MYKRKINIEYTHIFKYKYYYIKKFTFLKINNIFVSWNIIFVRTGRI